MGDNIDYGEVFGVDMSEATEEAQDTGAGAEEQEVTDPAEETDDTTEETGGAEVTESGQSAQDNARYAAARRKAEAERDAAVAKAKEEALLEKQKAVDEVYKDLGLTNPYTKKPITSKAEYDSWKQQADIEKKSMVAKKSGMTDGEFNEFVANLPEVKAAREAKAQAEETMKQAQAEQAKVKLDKQMAEIQKLDPSIKSLDDLRTMENYEEFYDRVKRGQSLVEAYKLTNFDKLTKATADTARQAAINSMSGKSHLEKTSGRGAGAVTVPKEILDQYRMYNPDATDAEIQKHYNRHIKK